MIVNICWLQQIDTLIQKMDPDSSGHISFSMFLHGVETYLSGKFSFFVYITVSELQ